jgi:transcriptional regulator with XRE-family HTH domain
MELSEKVKEIRLKKGISQELLAEESGLSLRTIQRIESGQTEPRGDTLKRIASSLQATPDDLIGWTQKEDKSFLSALNMSSLAFILFPLLGFIIPLIMWIFKKDKIIGLRNLIREIINFQVLWSIIILLVYVSFVGITNYRFWKAGDISPSLMINPAIKYMTYGLLYFYNIILVLINTVRIKEDKEAKYFPKIVFVK